MSSNWEHKLFNYKTDPPPTAWEAIAAGLDAEKTSFPDKLYQYAEAPPATAWPAIEAQLPATPARVVPLRILRYAVAAALLLAMAGVAYFTNTGTANNETAAHTIINASPQNTAPQTPPANRQVTHYNVPPQPSTAAAATDPAKKQKVSNYAMAAARKASPLARKQVPVNLAVEPAFATGLDVVPLAKNIIDTDRADRYMIATPEEGDPVRLPKKVYSAFACPEDDPRHQACELRLTQLQQKMSASFTPDFVHFMDLLKNLQEN